MQLFSASLFFLQVTLDGLGRLLLVRASTPNPTVCSQPASKVIQNLHPSSLPSPALTSMAQPEGCGGRRVRLRCTYGATVENGEACRLMDGPSQYTLEHQGHFVIDNDGVHIKATHDKNDSLHSSEPESQEKGGQLSESHIEGEILEIRDTLYNIQACLRENLKHNMRTQDIAQSWHDVALVLDRFFFIMYIVLIAVSLVTLFPRPK